MNYPNLLDSKGDNCPIGFPDIQSPDLSIHLNRPQEMDTKDQPPAEISHW